MARWPWTFTDFHWNEPFDKDLIASLSRRRDINLWSRPKADVKAYEGCPMQSPSAAPDKVRLTQGGTNAETGREIPIDEIAKTLDMFGERIEANYKAMTTWSGTYDLVERSVAGDPR